MIRDNLRDIAQSADAIRKTFEPEDGSAEHTPGVPEPGSPRDIYDRTVDQATEEYKTGLDLAYEELQERARKKLESNIQDARDAYYHRRPSKQFISGIPGTLSSQDPILKNRTWPALHQGGHPMFNMFLVEMSRIHANKNKDYAADKPLSNLRSCEALGIPAYKGCFVRLTDKYQRAANLIASSEDPMVKEESLEDTLIDLSIYSILTIILLREKRDAEELELLESQKKE